MKKQFTLKRTIFFFLFIAMVFVGKKINFSGLVGAENQFFTLFQFFGPIAGSFLGGLFGAGAVLVAQLFDYISVGKVLSLINIVRLTPMIFAALYFAYNVKSTQRKKIMLVIVPAFCITAFVFHPVGQQVWFFSLYWFIPIIGAFIPDHWRGKLLFRSYGATFTAHAVGGAAWIWTVPMPAEAWIGLIPIVAVERLLFGAGIAGSYVVMNTALDVLAEKYDWAQKVAHVDKRYALTKLIKRA